MRGVDVNRAALWVASVMVVLTASPSFAVVTELVPWSLDTGGLGGGGLTATATLSMERVQVSGTRVSPTAWGLGSVNYVAGATVYVYGNSPGTLDVDLIATGPAGAYGSGSGTSRSCSFGTTRPTTSPSASSTIRRPPRSARLAAESR